MLFVQHLNEFINVDLLEDLVLGHLLLQFVEAFAFGLLEIEKASSLRVELLDMLLLLLDDPFGVV